MRYSKQVTPTDIQQLSYPLFCVDRGSDFYEHEFLGPFGSDDEALSHAGPEDEIRRCRRVCATEIYYGINLEIFLEQVEDCAQEGDLPVDAWADFTDAVVTLKPGAAEALRAWAAQYLEVAAYICEGDE